MWLDGNQGAYWVEAGYATYATDHANNVEYFWADSRPNGGGYSEHVEGLVPSGDYGKYTNFQIYQLCCNSFYVVMYSPSVTYNGTSTANSMSPSDVKIGQELFGLYGASAPTASFINNGYFDVNNNEHSYTTQGTYGGSSPPYKTWVGTSLVFQTHCC